MSDVTNTGQQTILYLTAGRIPTSNETAQIGQFAQVLAQRFQVRVQAVDQNMDYGYGIKEGDYVAHDTAAIPDELSTLPVITPTEIPPALSTQATINSGVEIDVPVTGTYTSKITPTIVGGVITGFVLG